MALSIPIIFFHMYTLGRIPALRQGEFYILFVYRTIEVLWASDKGCHVLKKSPENMLVALTCMEAVDSSGDTSARKPSIWGMILSLSMLLHSRKAGIFLQGSLVLTVRELGETCPMMLLCQLKRVEYMGRG